MAAPNYQFEKRKRDLEKKAKKEEKRLRKLEADKNPSGPAVIELTPPPESTPEAETTA